MSELTKQYFDKQLGKLATKEDIKNVRVVLETKIENVKTGIETKIESEIAGLARMTNNGLEEIKNELNVKKEVENLNHRMTRIEHALNIKS